MAVQHANLSLRPAPEQICPACTGRGLVLFYEVRSVPVDCTAVFETRNEALKIPHGDIVLGLCENCGYVHNTAFDPGLLENRGSYEDQQGFSPTFKKYAEDLAEDLIRKYDLHNKVIVEIGCGKGDFLESLCSKGRNRCIGIDPKSTGMHDDSQSADIRFFNELYSVDHGRLRADLICCRHTLEHIHYPAEFIRTIRRSIPSDLDTPVFFELPDVTRIFGETAFWDIYYEHCGYYSPGSLAALFRRSGFEISEIKRAYQGQHVLLHAVLNCSEENAKSELEETPAQLYEKIQLFSQRLESQLEHWNRTFKMISNRKKRAVIWGSGSKCVGFMTALSIGNQIEYVVDINPRRNDTYIPKFGKKIVSPKFLRQYKPDIVIIMNSIYFEEIQNDLNSMGLNPEVVAV